MKTYLVDFTACSNDSWMSRGDSCIVEAESEEEARAIVKNFSTGFEEYYVDNIKEVENV